MTDAVEALSKSRDSLEKALERALQNVRAERAKFAAPLEKHNQSPAADDEWASIEASLMKSLDGVAGMKKSLADYGIAVADLQKMVDSIPRPVHLIGRAITFGEPRLSGPAFMLHPDGTRVQIQ